MMIALDYCLSVQNNLPCPNTFGCWKERVDVTVLLKAKFTDEELQSAFNTVPKSRLQRILESVETVRSRRI
ncbi:MAG: hypothetical protein ABFD12_12475 [Syntrophorhabdus sp.]